MPQNLRFERPLVWLKPRFLGDAVMATPLLAALTSNHLTPTVLASPHVRELLSSEPGLDLLESGTLHGFSQTVQGARRLRAQRFDSVFLVNRSFRSALTSMLAGIPIRIGHTTEGRGLLLTHKVAYDEAKLECECYGDLARCVGIDGSFSHPRLTILENERERGRQLLAGAVVGIQPGATAAHKLVSPDVLVSMADRLVAQGLGVALLGAGSEQEAAQAFQDRFSGPMTNLVGKCSLRESMGVIGNLKLLVGGDTGLMHIATALGTPNVAVFGPTPISKWGHKQPHTRALQAPEANALKMPIEPIWEAVTDLLGG